MRGNGPKFHVYVIYSRKCALAKIYRTDAPAKRLAVAIREVFPLTECYVSRSELIGLTVRWDTMRTLLINECGRPESAAGDLRAVLERPENALPLGVEGVGTWGQIRGPVHGSYGSHRTKRR